MEEAVVFDASELESLKRADLQALAKRVGIKANGKTVDIIEGLREHATKHQLKGYNKPPTAKNLAEIDDASASDASIAARTPAKSRVIEQVEPAPQATKSATPRVDVAKITKEVEAEAIQKNATPKAKEETAKSTPKHKKDTPKMSDVEEIATIEPKEKKEAVTRIDSPREKRRSLRLASPSAPGAPAPAESAAAELPAVAVNEEANVVAETSAAAPAAPAPAAPVAASAVPVFQWAEFKDDSLTKVPRDDTDSSTSSRASSTSESERLSALKAKAKPALAHKVLNKLKSPIKKPRTPIRVPAPRPPVPVAKTSAAPSRALNMPNFDKLHKQEFSRRESLNSFQKRQAAPPKPVVAAPTATTRPKQPQQQQQQVVAAPEVPSAQAKSASVSFVASVPSTPQAKRRLSKPATPFAGKDRDTASSADEESDKSNTARPPAAAAPRPPTIAAIPKRPAPTSTTTAKKPKFDLQASLAKGALPYKAAVANPAPRVLKEVNASSTIAAAPKRPATAESTKTNTTANNTTEARKKMRASLAVQPTENAAGRRLSTVN